MKNIYAIPLHLIVLMTCCTAVFSAQNSSVEEDRLTSQIRNPSSCFDGIFTDLPTYIKHMKTLPSVGDDPTKLAQAEKRYHYWRDNFECQWFDYVVDNILVKGFYIVPLKVEQTSLPVVVFNHGGNADIGAVKSRYLFGKLFPLAAKGYVVVGSQYRGNGNRDNPHPNPLLDEFGGRDVRDVSALLDLLPDIPMADSTKVALWGISRGGMMAYLAAKIDARFKAVVAQSAPVDLIAARQRGGFILNVFDKWIPGYREFPEKVLRERSVIYWAQQLTQPLFIIHGNQDPRIPASDIDRFAAKLAEQNHDVVQLRFPDGKHNLGPYETQIINQMDVWLQQNFRQGKQAAN